MEVKARILILITGMILFCSGLSYADSFNNRMEKNLLKANWDNLLKISAERLNEKPEDPLPAYFQMFAMYALGYVDEINDLNKLINKYDEDAEKLFPVAKRLVEENPENPYAYVLMEYAHYYSGDFKNARETLKKALNLSEDYGPIYTDMSMIYDKSGKSDLSLKILDEGMKKTPGCVGNYFYGVIYNKKAGNDKRASEIVDKALKLKNLKTAYFHYQKAVEFFKSDNHAGALNLIDKGLKIKPGHYKLNILKGDVFVKSNKPDKAETAYEKAKENMPEEQKIKHEKYLARKISRVKQMKKEQKYFEK